MNKIKCECCYKQLPQTDFLKYKTNPPVWRDHSSNEQYTTKCKNCYLASININDIHTVLPVLEEFNVPFLEYEWGESCRKCGQAPRALIRYINLMKLRGYYEMEYKDSDYFNALARQKEECIKMEMAWRTQNE